MNSSNNEFDMKVEQVPTPSQMDVQVRKRKRRNDRKKPEYYKMDKTGPSSTNPCHAVFQCYRKGAFSRARKTHKGKTLKMLEKFNRWHSQWLRSNTTEEDQRNCNDWLVEPPPFRNDDDDNDGILFLSVHPCNRVEETPYHLFKRYLISGPRRQ